MKTTKLFKFDTETNTKLEELGNFFKSLDKNILDLFGIKVRISQTQILKLLIDEAHKKYIK
jgi:hypothetical protein